MCTDLIPVLVAVIACVCRLNWGHEGRRSPDWSLFVLPSFLSAGPVRSFPNSDRSRWPSGSRAEGRSGRPSHANAAPSSQRTAAAQHQRGQRTDQPSLSVARSVATVLRASAVPPKAAPSHRGPSLSSFPLPSSSAPPVHRACAWSRAPPCRSRAWLCGWRWHWRWRWPASPLAPPRRRVRHLSTAQAGGCGIQTAADDDDGRRIAPLTADAPC